MYLKVYSEIAVIRIDLGKNSLRLVGLGSALQPWLAKQAGRDTEVKGARHVSETQ